MDIAITTVNRVFKTYQGQARIAELNSKNPVKRIQGQRDRVSISIEARAALAAQGSRESSRQEPQNGETQTAQTERANIEKIEENTAEPSLV
jgi:hypothetical protein